MQFSVAPVFLPGPRPDPILGWRGALLPFAADPLGYMIGAHRQYGELVALSRSSPVMLFAFGPEHNRQLLSNAQLFHTNVVGGFPVPPDSSVQRITGGLLAMNGAQHQQQRQLMLPSFHRQHVADYRAAMVEMIERVLARWAPGDQRDIAQEMRELTLSVALKTLFSLDHQDEGRALGQLFTQSLEIRISPLEQALPLDLPITNYGRLLRLAERIEASVRAIIAQRRTLGDEHRDVLATLIAAHDEEGQRLSDDDLVAQTYTIFVAGHETSSNALTWTLFLLEQHPDVLADLLDELAAECQGAAPTLEQLGRLPLLDRVVKESLRLMPPAGLLIRTSTGPFSLGCYELPADTTVFLSPFVTHRLPELYDRPQAFWPGRWEGSAPSPYEYLPFGAGPRLCLGQTFAQMEIKLALALIVQRFRLALPASARVDPELPFTLRPRGGLQMRIFAQDRQFQRATVTGTIHQIVDLEGERALMAA